MRKIYVSPTVETFKVHMQGMLAASVNVNDTEYDSGKGVILGRESDFDDEE